MRNKKNISGLTSKKYGLKTIILPALSVFFLCSLACAQNLLKNGDFSDLDGQKKPKDWIMNYEGNGLEGSTVIVPGPEGKKALKIECSKFPLTQNQKWIIIKQDSILKTRKGQKLLVSFWVKKEKITSPLIDVWLMNISPWSTIAKTTVPVSEKWEKVEAILTPNIDSENTRFELFFTEEGALYLSDISVTETDKEEIDFNPVRRKMEKNQLPAKEKNIIVNSGFETGIDGWGISDFDYTIAQIDNTQFFHGKKSVCLDFSEDKLPISYSDYPQSKKTVMQKIQFTGQGWLRLEKGAQYTLSLYGMANNENQNAVIGVYYMTKKKDSKTVSLSPQWKRYDVSFTAQDIFAFVFIDSSAKTYTEKIWIDAVQLEKSSAPSEYTPRFPAEMAIYAKRKGNIYYAGEEISVSLVKFFHDVSAKPKLSLSVIDYRSNVVFATQGPVSPEEGNKEIKLPVKENGYYTLSASVSGENYKYMLSIPFIIIYPYAEKYGAMNARFGINHSYYSDLAQEISREAGIGWIRDWSLKWDAVEHEQGKFDFSSADVFYSRAKKMNMKILSIFPDPAAAWAGTAPAEVKGKKLGDAFADLWYLPKEMNDYKNYVKRCIEQYSDTADAFEIINEPFKAQGWSVDEKYDLFLKAAKEACRAVDKNKKIMRTGLVYFKKNEANVLASRFSDLLSEHIYPEYNDTKYFLQEISLIDNFFRSNSINQDIWVTEYGKYADDNPHFQYARFSHFLLNGDERTSAAYSIKYFTVMISHGISKIFFHSRTWPLGLNIMFNSAAFDMLFKYDLLPYKFFPACNAFSWLLPPGTAPGLAVNEAGPVFAYSFKRANDKALILWTDKQPVKLKSEIINNLNGIELYNMMGGRMEKLDSAGDEPVYLIGPAEKIDLLEKMLIQ